VRLVGGRAGDGSDRGLAGGLAGDGDRLQELESVTELRFAPAEVLGSSKVLTVDDAVTVEVRR
jgi:hypothetical protein